MPIGNGGFVDRSTHEDASIASAAMHLAPDADASKRMIEDAMRKLGQWVEESGGVVGHIKCTVTEQRITALSYTADEVQEKNPEPSLALQFAAIVFGIDQEDLQMKVWNLLHDIAA